MIAFTTSTPPNIIITLDNKNIATTILRTGMNITTNIYTYDDKRDDRSALTVTGSTQTNN